jgi:hypothetical protein
MRETGEALPLWRGFFCFVLAAAAQAESARALLASNARLDAIRGELNSELIAIRDELNALNEKASVAAMPTLLPSGNSRCHQPNRLNSL